MSCSSTQLLLTSFMFFLPVLFLLLQQPIAHSSRFAFLRDFQPEVRLLNRDLLAVRIETNVSADFPLLSNLRQRSQVPVVEVGIQSQNLCVAGCQRTPRFQHQAKLSKCSPRFARN